MFRYSQIAPALVVLAWASSCVYAQEAAGDPSRLTLDRIFASRDFDSESLGARWLADGRGYTLLESAEGGRGRDIVRVDPETGDREVLVPSTRLVPNGEPGPLAIDDYRFSDDGSKLLIYTNSKRVWRVNSRGDYWVLDRTSRELRQLGGDAPPASLMHAKFSPDGLKVGYVRDNDLYVEEVRGGAITRLTHSPSPDQINGTFDWVYEEEFGLRDGFRWSPDSQQIAYWQLDTSGVRAFPLVNNAAGLYPEVKWIKYPKVGEQNPSCRVGVVAATGGDTRWLGIPGDTRDHYIAYLEWSALGGKQELVIQQLNRLQNTVRVMIADPAGNWVKSILTDRDDAWVDLQPDLDWIDSGKHFLWLSERSGWRHLYRVDRTGQETTPITSGSFDVIRLAGIDEAEGWAYFDASPENATQSYLFRARLDGSSTTPERVSPENMPGTHSDKIAPGGRWSIHQYSQFDTPPVIDLVRLPSGERVRTLVDNQGLKDRFAALKKRPVEFLKVKISDGVELDAWRILPPDFDPARSYPLLVHVYGEPAGQTVLDAWGGNNALWHRMMAERGYVVMSFDNRGTPAPRGRAWRKSVYRKIGILAPEDQAEAVRAVLRDSPYLDPSRVGVWGWSGGGSMSLNAIFKYPDLYATAVSVAPVPNQRFYDTIYQERYMGLPGDNVQGFKEGSPISHASRLKGKLLLIHGTGDDNCHYQGTEALIDELIRHDKPFSMMAYPNRSHSISEGENTTRHLRGLMTRYLLENLPAGPVSR
ncbi:DPP IV N-terminal domain-containing protein [Tundrisphaera lichenicola]|uniref:S9 family peptidase n=1 Tax=Tundrisphaera lichenicola TaxID=2029860 RepID=UPI003EBA2779